MQLAEEIKAPTNKIYKEKMIWLAAYLGGPMAAGYIIAVNFNSFNEKAKARKTWVYTIFASIIIFGGIFMIPDDVNIPNQIIPFVYTGIAYYLIHYFQGVQIESYVTAGGLFYSWWRVFLVGIIGMLTILIPIFLYLFISGDLTAGPSDVKNYGQLQHEITFDKTNISVAEIDKLAEAFTATGFFSNDGKTYVYPKKVGNKYEISLSGGESKADIPAATKYFKQLRTDLQFYFPNNHIVINLVIGDLNNVVQRLE